MPDRLLRAKILTSDSVNRLSWPAEVFYRRLMSIVDDFGRYDARPAILRADMYQLKLDRVTEPDIAKWMNECSDAGLVRIYLFENRKYLEVLKFNQRLRAMKSKYPSPEDCEIIPQDIRRTSAGHPQDIDMTMSTDTEAETEERRGKKSDSDFVKWKDDFDVFWKMYDKKQDRAKCENKFSKLTKAQKEKLFVHLPEYVKSTPDRQFRKNPATYLNNECWNDEHLPNTTAVSEKKFKY